MAITVVTKPEQGFNHPSGNLTDAIAGAMALYNMPQNMRLAMEQKRLANAQAQQNLTQQKTGFEHEQSGWKTPGNLGLEALFNPNAGGMTQGSVPGKPPDDGIAPPIANAYGPGSIANIQGDPPPAENTNQSNWGTNDKTVTGTDANYHLSLDRFDPLSSSALTASQGSVLNKGNPSNPFGASPSTLGMNGRGNPNPSPGAGDSNTPFPSTSSSDVNAGMTRDNSASLPRGDSNTLSKAALGAAGAKLTKGQTIRQNGQLYTVGD